MAEAKTEQEPSIEEILESIRQIISEDVEEPEKQAAQTLGAVKEPAVVPSDLSLTPKAEASIPPSNLSLTPAPAPAAPPAVPLTLKPEPAPAADKKSPPLDLTEKVSPSTSADESSSMTIELMDSPMTNNENAPRDNSSLLSPETATAVTDSLAKILASNVAIETEASRAPGKVTLEDLARDLMKPLIKTWLDQNLPGIIEKAVQKEVEKLSRRVMDR